LRSVFAQQSTSLFADMDDFYYFCGYKQNTRNIDEKDIMYSTDAIGNGINECTDYSRGVERKH
jgi:hypothetical protein